MTEHVCEWRWHSVFTEDGIDCRLCAEEGYSPSNWMDRDEVVRRLNATERLSAKNEAWKAYYRDATELAEAVSMSGNMRISPSDKTKMSAMKARLDALLADTLEGK